MSKAKINLAALTREQKYEVLEALEEKKRRKREQRAAFKPHEEQLLIIRATASKRLLLCGNGFGKTAMGANEALWAVNGFNPILNTHTAVPAKVVVVLDAPEKVADVWLPELRKWQSIEDDQLAKLGKPYYSKISFPNGSELRFMFHLQEELAFESLETDFVILDEPCPRSIWIALLRSGRKKGRKPRFLLLGTPIAQAWLREYHQEWLAGNFPDTEFFKGNTEANRVNLADGYIEDFSRHLTEREKATRLQGEFFNTDGLALSELFNRKTHVVTEAQLPGDWRTWPAVISSDPHPNKPTHACTLLAGPDGQMLYAAERQAKQIPREWAKWVKGNWLVQYLVADIITDNFGSGDFTGGEGFKSFVEVWRSEGVRVRPTTYDEKSDADFLERIQEALYIPEEGKKPKLLILASCTGIIKDIENVAWQAQKGTEEYKPKLEIGNKDYLACLKYALAAKLTYGNAARKITRPPGIIKQATQQGPRKLGTVEAGWAAKKRAKSDWGEF